MDPDSAWAADVVARLVNALPAAADAGRAPAMQAYMKDVAPFLGIMTPQRRSVVRDILRASPDPGARDVLAAVALLWAMPEREYAYAATDVLARYQRLLPAASLDSDIRAALTTKPWWDTVDALGTAAVTPLVSRHHELVGLMWSWLDSPDRWLVRAAIGHQRGLKAQTDIDRLVAMCGARAADREFFIAKAAGWALRDLAHLDLAAAQRFSDDTPQLSAVARRELRRGIEAATARRS